MPTITVGPGSALELQEIADALGKARKVVVVTGAGISTNCGIPDFRSENGLYSLIQAQYDAALQNPPWENAHNFDIDDRPKKKRRVTDRWYYEIVPGTGPPDNTNDALPEVQRRRSPRTQFSSTTSRSTPAASRTPESSLLSSPRSTTPERPSEEFMIEGSLAQPTQAQNLLTTILTPSSYSLRSRFSRSSSVLTTVEISQEDVALSQSSAPSSALKPKDSLKDSPQSSHCSIARPSLPNLKGRDLFDSMIWSDPFTTSIFYMFMSSLRQKIRNVESTTATHKFLRTLRDSGRLVRNYTQNIDCLEEREGLSTDLTRGPGSRSRFYSKTQREPRPRDAGSPYSGGVECVLLHGSLVGLRCGICSKSCSWDSEHHESTTLSGSAPACPSCIEYNAKRTRGGRRGFTIGQLRPDIVLYGEEHPNASLVAPLITHDLSLSPDFLLIMGTSLKVHGLKVIVKEFAKAVHKRGGIVVFVNRTKPPESTWGEFIDYWVEWDCDEWVLDLKQRRGEIWLPRGSQEEGEKGRHLTKNGKAETKVSKAPRPQAIREDKMNGVYHTFKILDSLRQLKDSSGKISERPIYWKKVKRLVAPVIGAEPRTQAQTRKSLPAPKTSSKAGNATKGVNAKKRRSCPTTLQENKAKFGAELCDRAPDLDPTPSPKSGRNALSERPSNAPSAMPFFQRSFSTSTNHFPSLPGLGSLKGGLDLPKGMNLITHPPSGATVPIYTPKSEGKPAVERKPMHSYGTRAAQRFSTETTIIVDTPRRPSLYSSAEDTIIVAIPPADDKKFPTPPASNPITPDQQRIKLLGSLETILSSPEDSESSTVYYDAVEHVE